MGIANAWRELWRPNPSTLAKPRRRNYAGASMDRYTASWVNPTSSADTEIKGSVKKLRSRARQLIRDQDYCRNAIRAIVENVAGCGPRLQAQVRMARGGRLNPKINDQIERSFAKWSKASSCDVAGKLTFNEMVRTAVSAWASDGEVFIRLIRGKRFGDSDVPFALQILEADMIDEDYQGGAAPKGWQWRMGILLDEWNKPKKYAILTKHPGDTLFVNQPTEKERHIIVNAEDIIHLATFTRPGQTRGVTWMASAIQRMHHLEGYEQAEIIRARASSCLTAYIQSPEGELNSDGLDEENERVYDMAPAQVKYLAPGESVTVPDLNAPDGQFEPFVRAMIRALSASIGISYATLSRDSSQSNYSSSRLDLLQDQQSFKALQSQLKEILLEKVYKEWLELSVLGGTLQLPNYQSEPERYQLCRFMFSGMNWIDPKKEVEAASLAVKAGFKLQSQVLSELSGTDLEEFLIARKAEQEMAASYGLNFETDSTNIATQAKVDETPNDSEENGT